MVAIKHKQKQQQNKTMVATTPPTTNSPSSSPHRKSMEQRLVLVAVAQKMHDIAEKSTIVRPLPLQQDEHFSRRWSDLSDSSEEEHSSVDAHASFFHKIVGDQRQDQDGEEWL